MWIPSWLKRRRLDLDEQDFQEEIRAHLAMAEQERIADGVDPESARYAALKEFGNVTRTTEDARRVWTPSWLEAIRDYVSDVRYARRALAKNPVFSLTVIGVLTLGIGLNAAVFSMAKGLALSPVAGVEGSARLSVITAETSAGRAVRLSYPDYQYLRDNDRAFSGLFGSVLAFVGLGRGPSSRSLSSELVTGNYFQVLGVRAQRGRTLLPSDENGPGRNPVAVISDGLWRRDFGADPEIVGKTIDINNYPLTVVGVADPSFHGTIVTSDVEVFIPVTMAPQLGFNFASRETSASGILSDRRAIVFYPQGYLRPGVSRAAATAQAEALWAARARDLPLTDAAQRLRVVPFWQMPLSAPTYMLPTLVVLIAMGLLVLLVACANIAGLVLVRGVSRRGEIAMRLALGATRGRVVRLLVIETLVLALPGAMLGVLLATQGTTALAGYAERLAAPQRVFFNIDVSALDITFAVLVACGCALFFGFVPALRSSRVDLVTVINEDASPRGAARGRLRAGLVVAQVAVSLLLLVGAELVSRSFDEAQRADPGFDRASTTSLEVDVKYNGYDEASGRLFYRRLLDTAREDAAVESAALAAFDPLGLLDTPSRRVAIDGYHPRRDDDLAFLFNVVTSDYFRTLRINLVSGRPFDERDDATAPPVVIVNNTFAERFWGGAANALGKRVRVADAEWRTVVGVAADIKYLRINESPRPYLYLPFPQSYRPNMILHTRGPGPVDALVRNARAQVQKLDPDLPIVHASSLAEGTRGALIFFNLTATMLLIFGVAGLALAAMGTYGLVSYTVKQSTHEIGIRMALGATGVSVVRGYLGRGLRLGAMGAALGVITALALSRLLGSVLYGVSSTDAASFARALAVVMGGVIVATIIPAWSAARIDPIRALRHQ